MLAAGPIEGVLAGGVNRVGLAKVNLIRCHKTNAEAHDSPHFSSDQILRRFAPIPYQIGEFRG
jgi:hypothetical protein